MIFAQPRPMMGWGQPQMGLPQMHPGMAPGMQPGMQPGMPQPGMQQPGPGMQPGMQLPPELLARLQQMQGLGGQQQAPQMGLGRGIQPVSPASAYSFR